MNSRTDAKLNDPGLHLRSQLYEKATTSALFLFTSLFLVLNVQPQIFFSHIFIYMSKTWINVVSCVHPASWLDGQRYGQPSVHLTWQIHWHCIYYAQTCEPIFRGVQFQYISTLNYLGLNYLKVTELWESKNLCNYVSVKWHEVTPKFVVGDYVRDTISKEACMYNKYMDHLSMCSSCSADLKELSGLPWPADLLKIMLNAHGMINIQEKESLIHLIKWNQPLRLVTLWDLSIDLFEIWYNDRHSPPFHNFHVRCHSL